MKELHAVLDVRLIDREFLIEMGQVHILPPVPFAPGFPGGTSRRNL